jgi:hypothetical protein
LDARLVSDETSITLPFADGDYQFFLPLPRVVAAEREADCSIFELFSEIGAGVGAVGDELILISPSAAALKQCHAVIRNALIGGGQGEEEARKLLETYCYPARPAIADLGLTYKILGAAIYGVRLKKKDVPEGPSDESPSEKDS